MDKPESVKYYVCPVLRQICSIVWRESTKGRKIMETKSSSFSVNAMDSPPLRGTMSPARKLPW